MLNKDPLIKKNIGINLMLDFDLKYLLCLKKENVKCQCRRKLPYLLYFSSTLYSIIVYTKSLNQIS